MTFRRMRIYGAAGRAVWQRELNSCLAFTLYSTLVRPYVLAAAAPCPRDVPLPSANIARGCRPRARTNNQIFDYSETLPHNRVIRSPSRPSLSPCEDGNWIAYKRRCFATDDDFPRRLRGRIYFLRAAHVRNTAQPPRLIFSSRKFPGATAVVAVFYFERAFYTSSTSSGGYSLSVITRYSNNRHGEASYLHSSD